MNISTVTIKEQVNFIWVFYPKDILYADIYPDTVTSLKPKVGFFDGEKPQTFTLSIKNQEKKVKHPEDSKDLLIAVGSNILNVTIHPQGHIIAEASLMENRILLKLKHKHDWNIVTPFIEKAIKQVFINSTFRKTPAKLFT